MKIDIYTEITNEIINIIEAGQATHGCVWDKGASGLPVNHGTKQNYSGINVLLLWNSAFKQSFTSSHWLTYKQAQELGGKVKKGSKGTPCIFFNHMKKESKTNPDEIERIPFIKPFTVFNLDQIDGLEQEETPQNYFNHEASENLLKHSGAKIIELGTRACYVPSKDTIFMPERHLFTDEKDFYSVAFHELTHWTGAKKRLNRDFSGRFGSESYAFEELIAELGASFLCSDHGFTAKTLPDHAGYLESWLKVLKNDKKAIFTAASQASKAHAFIKNAIAKSENAQRLAA
ncbi:MAG: zincin-like metallopeptidase domain-containing protein [Pseudomonadota bacterium]